MQTRYLPTKRPSGSGTEPSWKSSDPQDTYRFIRLQRQPEGDYAEIRDKLFEGMTVQDIYDEAVRLEAGREKGSSAGS